MENKKMGNIGICFFLSPLRGRELEKGGCFNYQLSIYNLQLLIAINYFFILIENF